MKDLNVERTQKLLSRIMEFELAGVVRYTHYSLMVSGPNRIPIVAFMQGQASESLLHAQQAGEILTGLGGHPTLKIAPIDETYRHAVKDILEESAAHESRALKLYKELLEEVDDCSVYLEEFARGQIAAEEMHSLELRKMLRDIGVGIAPHHAHDHDDEKPAKSKKPKTPKADKPEKAPKADKPEKSKKH
jgi:bacterioferritin